MNSIISVESMFSLWKIDSPAAAAATSGRELELQEELQHARAEVVLIMHVCSRWKCVYEQCLSS